MRKLRPGTLLAVLIVSVIVASDASARGRVVERPGERTIEFTISMPAAAHLGTGLGVGILYDPDALRFTGYTGEAPDVFHFSPDAELVRDPSDAEGVSALLRLTWVNPAGAWAPASVGGDLATLHFERRSHAGSELRLFSLSNDGSHGFAAVTSEIPPDAVRSGWRLDTRTVEIASAALSANALQVFPPGQCTPDVDGNGSAGALTDGLIVLRHLFGFTGETLTNQAIGTGATRVTAADIVAFLAQSDCAGMLDLDANGAASALTDGLILLRHLFGFSGSTLVNGALAADAGRTSPDSIRTTIESYSTPREVLLDEVAIAAGTSMTDASGDFGITAVGGDVTVTLTQGTDYSGNRTLELEKTGSGEISIILPPAQAAPVNLSSTFRSVLGGDTVGSLADVASHPWPAFAEKWFYKCGAENRLPESVQQGSRPLVSSEPCRTPFSRLHLSQYAPARLMSACNPEVSSCYQSKSAVLFIHGFSPFIGNEPDGGGSGTWGELPNLVQAAGYVPFEFRWTTAARFDDVAVELKSAIQQIATRTGRQVHIVAHSFGGLLVRELLQSSMGSSVAPFIAGVATLGTPHSGIALSAACPAPDSLPLPAGSDNSMLEKCAQISCYQAGFNSLSNITPTPNSSEVLRSVYSLEGDPGYLITRLAQSVNSFPAVDWLALVGLVTRSHLIGADTFGMGDDLISYEGQRFLPSMSLANACPGNGVTTPLSTERLRGGLRLWERILGFTGEPTPQGPVTAPTDPGFTGGYVHNTPATVLHPIDLNRAKREAKVDCEAVSGCTHDTVRYLLADDFAHSIFAGSSWLSAHPAATITSETITFRLTVVDSVTGVPVEGAIVSVLHGAAGPSVTTGPTGQAALTVSFEPRFAYTLRIRARGYVSLQDSFSAGETSTSTPTELGTRYLVSQSAVGYGTLEGTVRNATTAVGISGAAVTVRRSDREALAFSGTASSSGTFSAGSLAAGTYIVSASAGGFVTGSSEVTVIASAARSANVVLSPLLASGQARIVLTWGVEPRDLDSHLLKIRADGSREYHIYFADTLAANGDNLDVDDIESHGPETVTIGQIDPSARYVYWVYHYAGAETIATSPARVTVTVGETTLTFNAPSTATGWNWVVFEIVNGQIIPCSSACNVAPLSVSDPAAAATKIGEESANR